jgi:hypothetical protein
MIYRKVLEVNILTFVFSDPENGEKGDKLGYAKKILNLHSHFFYFSPNFYVEIKQ